MASLENEINIRPTTSVYATYKRLSYKPWYAIAEFVDNSTNSYFKNRDELINSDIKNSTLRIEIIYDNTENTLTIYDNAFGMEIEDFQRAIVLDSPPSDTSGRSEFGMGLKTAACWFGSHWTVESTQYGSDRILIASVDVDELASSPLESIQYISKKTIPENHYTKITITKINKQIRGGTVTRVREHLSSMYRQDIRSGLVNILWNGVPLKFEDPEIYEEKDDDGKIITWKREMNFEVPWETKNKALPVSGWIGIRKQGKQRDAGLILLRRGRVIIGGPGEGYKPEEIFGQGNTFKSQRLIGELHLDNWPVTQAKDGFDWIDGLEEALISHLQMHTKEFEKKAESIRSNKYVEPKPISIIEMEKASINTKEILDNQEFKKMIIEEINRKKVSEDENQLVDIKDSDVPIKSNRINSPITYNMSFDKVNWIINLHWQHTELDTHWMSVNYPDESQIEIFLNTNHPFFSEYINDPGILELLQKLIISLALAEKIARITTGNNMTYSDPSDLRIIMNRILTKISSLLKKENVIE